MPKLYSHSLDNGQFEVWSHPLGIDVLAVNQVHGVEIATPETLPAEADGILATWEELAKPLAIKTADCLPIFIEGNRGVLGLHAGWRGLAKGILKRAELSLIQPRRAFLGPSIQACCFEVSGDFEKEFPENKNFKVKGKKFFFDLQNEAIDQLSSLFPDLIIEDSKICTACDKKFHSYRRDKTSERNWNLYRKG
jgi:YfiH family protein